MLQLGKVAVAVVTCSMAFRSPKRRESEVKSGDAACSSHSGCAHLWGNCCPTPDGVHLDCCGSGSAPNPAPTPPAPPTPPLQGSIRISGRQLLINGSPFHIKGVCWNPVGKGGTHPRDIDYLGFADRDGDLMKAAGINVVRTYEPITDGRVLDILWSKGIRVAMSVYAYGGAPANIAVNAVNAVKNHPAVLLWEVGNEWNYNGLYVGMSFQESRARVADVVRLVKQHDLTHPVVTVYGEIPDAETLRVLSEVDMWGINAYRGIGLGNLFDVWRGRSGKPMYMAEYGADAFDARVNRPNTSAQADATRQITQEIIDKSAVTGGVCSGGTIFEFADEWWKDSTGRGPNHHDNGGIAPGGGPHPDATFNEEWWGIVDIDRRPRAAYDAYRALAVPTR